MQLRSAIGGATALTISMLAGCGQPDTSTNMPVPSSTASKAVTNTPSASSSLLGSTQALPLAVPINAVMVAMVDFAADGIWRPAVSETPLTEKQWLLAEQDAVNLVGSATLITTVGTGAMDADWVADADWRRWAIELQQTALEAKSAVDQKDQSRLKLVGDHLVETCQACHQKFKPGLPVMGITRYPIYPKRDGSLNPP